MGNFASIPFIVSPVVRDGFDTSLGKFAEHVVRQGEGHDEVDDRPDLDLDGNEVVDREDPWGPGLADPPPIPHLHTRDVPVLSPCHHGRHRWFTRH